MQYTLATLLSSVKNMLEERGTALEGNFNTLVMGAEDACIVDLDLELFNAIDTLSFTLATQVATIPSGFLKVKTLGYYSGTRTVPMEERTYEYCLDYWPDSSVLAAPLFWAPLNTTQIYISPSPNFGYSATARGPRRPPSLTTIVSGTWLSLNCGDLLFKRVLIESEKFNIADDRLPMWRGEYGEELVRKQKELSHLKNRDYVLDTPPQPSAQEQ